MAWTDLKERDVSQQVCDFLKFHGWRRIRNQVQCSTNLVTGKVVASGEKGMADLLFIMYLANPPHALVLWIETKRKGAKPSEHQKAWQDKERLKGALVINVDHFEAFAGWYQAQLGWLHSASGIAPGNLDLFAADNSPPE